MKIAVIADTHWGIRNDNRALLDHAKKFIDNVFLPEIDKRQIKQVVHLGDLVDRRKYTNHLTAHRLREDFLDKLVERRVELWMIAGNHDTLYKTHNGINAFRMLGLDREEWVHIYEEPCEVAFCGKLVLFLPWIALSTESSTRAMEAIGNSRADICLAHLELKGVEMRKGSFSEIGQDASLFSRFKTVLTGHFHYKSDHGNIHYLGSPWEASWGDHGSERGFHIFDTETLELEFIQNPYKMFHRITYRDRPEDELVVDHANLSYLKDTYVRIIVESRHRPELFDAYIQAIEALPVIDVQVIDAHLASKVQEDLVIDQAESTIDILRKTVDSLDMKDDQRTTLNTLLTTLYHEAHNVQS